MHCAPGLLPAPQATARTSLHVLFVAVWQRQSEGGGPTRFCRHVPKALVCHSAPPARCGPEPKAFGTVRLPRGAARSQKPLAQCASLQVLWPEVQSPWHSAPPFRHLTPHSPSSHAVTPKLTYPQPEPPGLFCYANKKGNANRNPDSLYGNETIHHAALWKRASQHFVRLKTTPSSGLLTEHGSHGSGPDEAETAASTALRAATLHKDTPLSVVCRLVASQHEASRLTALGRSPHRTRPSAASLTGSHSSSAHKTVLPAPDRSATTARASGNVSSSKTLK